METNEALAAFSAAVNFLISWVSHSVTSLSLLVLTVNYHLPLTFIEIDLVIVVKLPLERGTVYFSYTCTLSLAKRETVVGLISLLFFLVPKGWNFIDNNCLKYRLGKISYSN